MLRILFALFLFCPCAAAQIKFEVKHASKLYDVLIEVEKCENKICEGKTTFTLFKKNSTTPFQRLNLDYTSFSPGDNYEASASVTRLDEQFAATFADYNFDGVDDLALCDGNNGPYGAPTYQIYLFSRAAIKFVLSDSFTELSQEGRLTMLRVNRKRKSFRSVSKAGCCLHMTEEFVVVNNRPKKVLEIVEDATIADEKRVMITTKRLVNGRWRKTVKYVARTG